MTLCNTCVYFELVTQKEEHGFPPEVKLCHYYQNLCEVQGVDQKGCAAYEQERVDGRSLDSNNTQAST